MFTRQVGLAVSVAAVLGFTIGCTGDNGTNGAPGGIGPIGPEGPAGAAGTQGDSGPQGDPGEAGPQGQPGTAQAQVGSISGTVIATTGSTPLGNVQISLSPGTLTTATAADGTFSLKDVPVGAYTMTFKRTGYADKTIAGVSVAMAGPTNVAVSLDTNAAVGGPSIVVADNLLAGFNQPVTVTAQVTASAEEDASALTYAWTQTSGFPATLSGANTSALSFTTLKFSDAKPGIVGRFGTLGMDWDDTGDYTFTLTVTDLQGHKTSASVHVASTASGAGLANTPVGIPVWLQADSARADAVARTAWSWTLDKSQVTGSNAVLLDPATNAACAVPCTAQYPSFTPDRAGIYTLTETDSSTTTPTVKTLTIYAGTWLGVMDSATNEQATCKGCHNDQPLPGGTVPVPDKFTPWKNTAHYSALKRKLDGEATSHFNDTCMKCHTLGNSPLATNGGWDDVAHTVGYSFPATLVPGNYQNLVNNYPTLAQLGSIQCESCHGPQNSGAHPANKTARISFGTAVCASCHQESPTHYKPSQWAGSKHSDVTLPPRVATVESKALQPGGPADPIGGAQHCARCHSAQGFARYTKQLANGATGRFDFLTTDNKKLGASNAPTAQWLTDIGLTNATVEPQTCSACHDPHANPTPVANIDCSRQANNGDAACAQLRVFDSINGLPNGQGPIAGVGSGAICMTCHNSRNGEHSDFQPTPPPYAETPHDGTVTDVVFGFNAYFMPRYSSSPHLAVQDTCAGCHYGVPTDAQSSVHQTSNHSFTADLTICSSCHGTAGVDGAALLAQSATQVADLDTQIDNHVKNVIYGLNQALTVAVSGIKCTPADKAAVTCASSIVAPQVPPANPPSTVVLPVLTAGNSTITRSGTTLTIQLLPATGGPTVNVDYYDPRYPANYPAQKLGTAALGKLSVPLRGIMLNGNYVFPPSSITAKAVWNTTLLKNDKAAAIHNLPFTNGVIGATNAALYNNPNTP